MILEFLFSPKTRYTISYRSISLCCSKYYVLFLQDCLNRLKPIRGEDEYSSWYQFCAEQLIPKYQDGLEKELVYKLKFPSRLIGDYSSDIYYFLKDNFTYMVKDDIRQTQILIQKEILKYKNRPYRLFDMDALQNDLLSNGVKLVD